MTSAWDVPAQGVKNIASSATTITGNSISILIAAIKVEFVGAITADSKKIDGTWKQSGMDFPVSFEPMNAADAEKTVTKPQTPKAPFPYEVEDITYTGAKTKITYGTTLTYPKGKQKVPVIILITGSGKQDRDESILGHQPFAVLADYFTKQGYAVLRVDDRGAGKTTGDFSQSTSEDFAQDVEEHLAYLKTKPFIDIHKIGLCGHSEGGMIAPMVAARNKDIAFVMLMAGPGIPITDLMLYQNKAVLLASGIDTKVVEAYLPLYKKLVISISNAKDYEVALQQSLTILQQWRKDTNPDYVKQSTNITDDASEKEFAQTMTKSLSTKWWQFFMNYNPQSNLEKVKCPVLAINGGADIQVVSKPNLDGIAAALKKGHNAKGTTKEFAGLNHLFQKCQACTVAEYGQIETTIEPEVLQYMGDWLHQTLK
jgi:pimeloyl-ACP methyl ester carboxylesterase